jgi:hypothetical protein
LEDFVNLKDAIGLFEQDRKGHFGTNDLASIDEAIDDLGLLEFEIYKSPSKKYPLYIRDVDDTIHIHRRMIVGRTNFVGTRSEPSKYKTYPFHRELENWVSMTGGEGRPYCLGCGIELPIVLRCDYCDFDHNEELE